MPKLSEALTWLHIRTHALLDIRRAAPDTDAARLAGRALCAGPSDTAQLAEWADRAAAADSEKAPDVDSDRVRLQRLVSLHARWLAMADTMEELALDSTEDSPDQLECYEHMRTLRDCAAMLDHILRAGMEANNTNERQ